MPSATVLIAAEDERTCRVLRAYLEQAGLSVLEAADGHAALERLHDGGVDLLVLDPGLPGLDPGLPGLDPGLPGLDGWAVLRELRRFSQIPVAVLAERGRDADRLLGYQLGADDCVVKPFRPREVAARLGALLRRARTGGPAAGALAVGALRLSSERRSVTAGGQPVELAPREYELLEFLARHPGQVFSRQQLLERVWGPGFHGDPRTVDTHIRKLRAKLGPAAALIRTAWGRGYALEP